MPAILDSLTIVVPAYNEAQRLGASLDRLLAWMDGHAPRAQIIVVDDGSRDGTASLVAERAAQEPRLHIERLGANRGKGAAVRRGVELATTQWVLFSDADLSTPIEEIFKLVAAIERGADIAIASRDRPDSEIERHQPAYREAMGRTFNGLVQALALPGFADTQCGFKLFSASAAKAAFGHQTIERFAFDVEVLYIARKLGFRIAEVGVRWVNDERTTVSPLKDASKMLLDIAKIRWRHRGLRQP
jgi:dolichyl-phosphate beta-glucosyltransferase